MGMGTDTRGTGSGIGSVICPKCGYAQEDRLDCKKCGIIFSKYYAMQKAGKLSAISGEVDFIAVEPSEQERKTAPPDVQLQIRDLSDRIAEVEFEKAARNQIRTDIKSLEQRVQDDLKRTSTQLEQLEKRFEGLSAPKPRQEP